MSDVLNVLVVRPDRLGDVILSTPVFEVIKRHYGKARLTILVREAMKPLLEGLPSVDQVMTYDPEGRHQGIKGFFRLLKELRLLKIRIAVVLQSDRKIAFALWLARVRYRVGPLSKIHSYFFYNRGVRQHRSQVEMHEADYNLQLLRKLGIRVGSRNVATRVAVSDTTKAWAKDYLNSKGVSKERPLVIVHPGMGGSALNWPESHYLELIKSLVKQGKQVIVTAGPTEGTLLDRMQEGLKALGDRVIYYGGREAGEIDRLAALLEQADLVAVASTGPLHVAVALGKPVLTFFPPIRVQSAIRWGPYVQEEERAGVLVPEVYCGEDFHCRGNLCNYFPCMKGLTVAQALEQANRLLSIKP